MHVKTEFAMDFDALGLLGALVYLGLTIGCPVAGNLVMKFQAKHVVMTSVLLNATAVILFGSAQSVNQLMVARFLIGLSQGPIFIYAPVWVDEFAPERSQTKWMSLLQANVALGIMFGYVMGGFVSNGSPELWRLAFYVQGGLLIPLGLGIWFVEPQFINAKGLNPDAYDEILDQESLAVRDGSTEGDDVALAVTASERKVSAMRARRGTVMSFAPPPRARGESTASQGSLSSLRRVSQAFGDVMTPATAKPHGGRRVPRARVDSIFVAPFVSDDAAIRARASSRAASIKLAAGRIRGDSAASAPGRGAVAAEKMTPLSEGRDEGSDEDDKARAKPAATEGDQEGMTMEDVDVELRPSPTAGGGGGGAGEGEMKDGSAAVAEGEEAVWKNSGAAHAGDVINAEASRAALEREMDADTGPPTEGPAAELARTLTMQMERQLPNTMWGQVKRLLECKIFVWVTWALAFLYFVVTGIQFWITDYLVTQLGADPPSVVIAFALTSLTAPTAGVFFGGWAVDKVGGYKDSTGRSMCMALRCCVSFGSAALFFALLTCFMETLVSVITTLWFVLFWGGCLVPPATGICISSVEPSMRSFSSAWSMTLYNLFGYAMAPLLCGLAAEWTDLTWGFRLVMLMSGGAMICLTVAWRTAEGTWAEALASGLDPNADITAVSGDKMHLTLSKEKHDSLTSEASAAAVVEDVRYEMARQRAPTLSLFDGFFRGEEDEAGEDPLTLALAAVQKVKEQEVVAAEASGTSRSAGADAAGAADAAAVAPIDASAESTGEPGITDATAEA